MTFQPKGEQGLFGFALIGLLWRQEKIAGELLGDGRAAFRNAPGFGVGERCAQCPAKVNAEMIIKTPVFGG